MENGGKRLGFHKNCVLSIHKPQKTCLLHSQTKFDKQQTFPQFICFERKELKTLLNTSTKFHKQRTFPLFSCLERQQTFMLTVNEIMHLVKQYLGYNARHCKDCDLVSWWIWLRLCFRDIIVIVRRGRLLLYSLRFAEFIEFTKWPLRNIPGFRE